MGKLSFEMRLLIFLYIVFCGSLSAQRFVADFDTLYAIPGKTKAAPKDLDAKVHLEVSPDSIFLTVEVSDDAILIDKDPSKGDRVEVWFGYPWMDFSDFIIGQRNKRNFIFRNTAESGDNADLERFIKNADYPDGILTSPETGKIEQQIVPEAKDLKREYIFFGLTRFSFKPDGSDVVHLDREKYHQFEQQMGLKMADLSKKASYSAIKTSNGYRLNIRMHNSCLGFARPEVMKKIRIAVDVFDADKPGENEDVLSICKNRFYGRAYYFKQIDLPFAMNVALPLVSNEVIKSLQINQDILFSTDGWKAFGFNSGSIVYAHDVISEQSLTEFYFFKMDLNLLESPKDAEVPWKRLDISYDDVTLFDQHEVYLIIDGVVYSGKKFRYTGIEKEDFFYKVFRFPDGGIGAAFYDYEVVDPLGFGEFGHTADEFIYIQNISGGQETAVFSAGQRLEGASAITIGENDEIHLQDIISSTYKWIELGKSFEVKVTAKDKKISQALKFVLNAEGRFVQQK